MRLNRRVLLCLVAFWAFSVTAFSQSNFKHLTFEAGGGIGIGKGAVGALVGSSYNVEAGAGWNFNRFFGVDAEYLYYGLPLKPSVIQTQSLPGASGRLHAVSLNGIVNTPRFLGRWAGYGIFGVGFYDRRVSARSQLLTAGTVCQPAWIWWDITCVPSSSGFISYVSPTQTLSSNSRVAGGFNVGGGLTHPVKPLHAKVFVEARYHRAYHADVETTFIPVTVGLRW